MPLKIFRETDDEPFPLLSVDEDEEADDEDELEDLEGDEDELEDLEGDEDEDEDEESEAGRNTSSER